MFVLFERQIRTVVVDQTRWQSLVWTWQHSALGFYPVSLQSVSNVVSTRGSIYRELCYNLDRWGRSLKWTTGSDSQIRSVISALRFFFLNNTTNCPNDIFYNELTEYANVIVIKLFGFSAGRNDFCVTNTNVRCLLKARCSSVFSPLRQTLLVSKHGGSDTNAKCLLTCVRWWHGARWDHSTCWISDFCQ